MRIKFCPKCNSENIINVRGDNTQWRCVDCRLEMPVFPEKELKSKSLKLNSAKREK